MAYPFATSARVKQAALPRKNQPMGLVGRREATNPPTTALAVMARGKLTAPALEPLRIASATALAIKASVCTHSDQAIQAAVRWLILPIPRPCSLAPSITIPPGQL